MQDFDTALNTFLDGIRAKLAAHFAKHFPSSTPPMIEISKGRRYIRVIKNDVVSRSVHCFVDTTNGDVLKADGWKTPAKHARGNIFNDNNGLDGVSVWGATYLR